MAPLTTERRAALLAYCKLTEFAEDPEVTALLETLYGAAADVSVLNDTRPEETAQEIWRDFCG